MAGLGGVFGEGSTARQLLVWGVLAQVISSLANPAFIELTKLANNAAPLAPLAANDAAEAVARRLMSKGDGEDAARDSGLDADVFGTMVKVAQHAPALSYAFELYRRGKIPMGSDDPEQVSLRGALTDSGIPEDWHTEMAALAVAIPTPAEVINALLEGQISKGEAKDRWKAAGGDPTWFDAAYNSGGQAPTPIQALELWNRGVIPEGGTGPGAVSYDQAFLEGPWRNKWLTAFKALRRYVPPPRTVTAMYHDGQITHDQAAHFLQQSGLDAELAAAYLTKSSATHTTTEKHLAKSEITKAYADGLLHKAQAKKALTDLKYTAADADLILALVDVHTKTSQLNSSVTRVRTLYLGGKLTDAQAISTLRELGVQPDQARAAVSTWRLLATHTTRELTAAQVESAGYYGFLTWDDVYGRLQAMGYDAGDAWLAMAVRNKGTTGLPPRPSSLGPAPKPIPPAKGP